MPGRGRWAGRIPRGGGVSIPAPRPAPLSALGASSTIRPNKNERPPPYLARTPRPGAKRMAVSPTGRERPAIAAEAFLRALADHGVDYFFCNTGTDFPPIVEAFARAKKTNAKVPKPILIPHENLAVGMAHGAYLMTGRPQAVMVHTTVGTANTINNLINLSL